jgi:hypothetical protein
MNAFITESFQLMASDMNQMHFDPGAILKYDLLADGLVWSDECPSIPRGLFDEYSCIRILLRYRTTILLGTPDENLKPYWDQALMIFPHWVGFRSERLKSTDDLISFYTSSKSEGDKCIGRWDKYMRRLCSSKTKANS